MTTSILISQTRHVFHQHDGVLRTHEALKAGVHPRTLYTMRDAGLIEQLSRGLFRRALDQTGGNVAAAARLLGIARNKVYRVLGKSSR